MAIATLAASHRAEADSLLDLAEADTLATLGAREALARTRRGAVLYPAPGLPALLAQGDELIARIRVRRAMTPPPGVQQARVLAGWSARLVRRGGLVASGAEGAVALPLAVVQIRPEDEGFAYRIRFAVPPWAPPGVYDLEVEGPGVRDSRHRAVRILPPDRDGLALAVVSSGEALWREAEPLSLLDPALVLVPGGLTEASRPLAEHPLATLAVPDRNESGATVCATLPGSVARAAAAAAGCPTDEGGLGACLVAALGGPSALEPCGDRLVTYLREAGPPAHVVGLGSVALLGLPVADGPTAGRAAALLELGGPGEHGRRILVPAPSAAGRASSTERWMERMVRAWGEVVVLAAEPPAEPDRPGGVSLVVTGPGPRGAGLLRGPAWLHLRREPPPPRRGPVQVWGLEPGRYRIGEATARPALGPADVSVADRRQGGLVARVRRPPPGRLGLHVVVPATEHGWEVVSDGRPARIGSAHPSGADPCEPGLVVLSIEVAPGPEDPLAVEVVPGPSRPRGLELRAPAGPVTVGAPATFEVLPVAGTEPPALVAWRLGDGTLAVGNRVEHRYRESGTARVCALALDRDGGVRPVRTRDVGVLPQGRAAVGRGDRLVLAVLAAACLLALLMVLARGNIVGLRHRSPPELEGR